VETMCEQCLRELANSPTAGASTKGASGSQNINNFEASFAPEHQSNMLALVYGERWDERNLTFAFPDQASDYGSYGSGEAASFSSFNNTQMTAALAAFSMLESYTGLNFTRLTRNEGSAEIRLSESNMPSTAWAYYPSNSYQSGDVWLDKTLYDTPVSGTYAWHSLMHEIGHSIGLKHGHDTSGYGALDAAHDQMSYSVMTYKSHTSSAGHSYTNEYYGYAQTYMSYDIAAAQALYGVNWTNYNAATTYSWSPATGTMQINGNAQTAPASNRIFSTIWDAGGNDLVDLSNYHNGTTGDMDPGGYLSFSPVQKAQLAGGIWADGNVYFALAPNGSKKRAYIEDLKTGSGDDFIFANRAENTIETKGGRDHVHGRGGHDHIMGNGGKDSLIGGPGADTLDGGLGVDTLKGGLGADTFVLRTGSGKDIIKDFTPGQDIIDVPDPSLATLTTSRMGHLAVDYLGNWAVLRGLTYDPTLDPLDFVI